MILLRFFLIPSQSPTRWWRFRWSAVPRVGEAVCLPEREGDPGFGRYLVKAVTWTPESEALHAGAMTVHAREEGCVVDIEVVVPPGPVRL